MRLPAVGLLLLLFCFGCHSTPAPQPETSYTLRGVIVSSDAGKGEVTVDSEEIPGFMGAMIMPYKLAQPNVATELHPGDKISARLRIVGSQSLVDQIVVTAQAKPDYKPKTVYNAPKPGQDVPDFRFTNQDGRTIHLAQFKGKALLVTFIYTRCPLPDYCIRMSRNFADVQKQLVADLQLQKRTHLLSISFDTDHDTPKVLRSYGKTYAGNGAFDHWDFAVPSAADVDEINRFFDVGVTPGPNRTLDHSLSTIVIGPDGKIFRWYPSNDWTPATAVTDLKEAIAQFHP
jgi:protein SCO1/2